MKQQYIPPRIDIIRIHSYSCLASSNLLDLTLSENLDTKTTEDREVSTNWVPDDENGFWENTF